ncbi:ABC-type antimicrobial peptide transport system permease subunit [Sporosarcina luteola]|nr:ABC-type antimicrobial peptide transport system permease subunit [Sporosarcina luteola]
MFQYIKSSIRERWILFLILIVILCTICFGYMGALSFSNQIVIQAKEDLDKNWRYQYDLLVTPASVDISEGLEEGWLAPQSSIASYGGISFADLQEIRDIPGIKVAAPLSLLGYVEVQGLGAYYTADEKGAYSRSRLLTTTFDGLSDITIYDFVDVREYSEIFGSNPYEWDPSNYTDLSNQLAEENDGWRTYMPAGFPLRQPNSLMVIAVDPVSENQLYTLDDSLTIGNTLAHAEIMKDNGVPTLPFIVLGNSQSTLQEQVTIERIHVPEHVSQQEFEGNATEYLLNQPRTLLVDISENMYSEEWRYATGELILTGGNTYEFRDKLGLSSETWVSRLTPISFTFLGDQSGIPNMKAKTVEKSEWDERQIPIYKTPSENDGSLPFNYTIIDYYDPEKITPLFKGSWKPGDPTDVYTPHHSMIIKNGAGDEIEPTPLFPLPFNDTYYTGSPDAITTLKAAEIFYNDQDYISSIRVVVDGVEERTDESQLKVEKVAREIMDRTGHQVHILLGSSASKVHIDLGNENPVSAGTVEEGWQQSGVSWSIQEQIEQSNVVLFIYLSLVGFIFCYTVITHSLLSRSIDFAMLRAIGWSRRKIFGCLAVEVFGLSVLSTLPVIILNQFFPILKWHNILFIMCVILFIIAIGYATGSRKALQLSPRAGLQGEGREWKFTRLYAIKGLWSYMIHQLIRRPLRFGLLAIVLSMTSFMVVLFLATQQSLSDFLILSFLGETIDLHLQGIQTLFLIAGILLTTSIVLLLLYLNISERKREFFVLRSIGWSLGRIRFFIGCEVLLVAAAGSAIGGSGAYLLLTFYSTIWLPFWLMGLIILSPPLLMILFSLLFVGVVNSKRLHAGQVAI